MKGLWVSRLILFPCRKSHGQSRVGVTMKKVVGRCFLIEILLSGEVSECVFALINGRLYRRGHATEGFGAN